MVGWLPVVRSHLFGNCSTHTEARSNLAERRGFCKRAGNFQDWRPGWTLRVGGFLSRHLPFHMHCAYGLVKARCRYSRIHLGHVKHKRRPRNLGNSMDGVESECRPCNARAIRSSSVMWAESKVVVEQRCSGILVANAMRRVNPDMTH